MHKVLVRLFLSEPTCSSTLRPPLSQMGWTNGLAVARDFDISHTRLRFVNASLAGVLVQEHRLDFELYDHATKLAKVQIARHGPPLAPSDPIPSMIATLQAAGHLDRIPPHTLKAWKLNTHATTRDEEVAAKANAKGSMLCGDIKRGWEKNAHTVPENTRGASCW